MKRYIKASTLDSIELKIQQICKKYTLVDSAWFEIQNSYSPSTGYLITVVNPTNLTAKHAEELGQALVEVSAIVSKYNER